MEMEQEWRSPVADQDIAGVHSLRRRRNRSPPERTTNRSARGERSRRIRDGGVTQKPKACEGARETPKEGSAQENKSPNVGATEGARLMPPTDADARRYFHVLTREQQADAIRKLAADGMSELALAAATRYSVEMIREILAAPRDAEAARAE
jgi:hypothetical protein